MVRPARGRKRKAERDDVEEAQPSQVAGNMEGKEQLPDEDPRWDPYCGVCLDKISERGVLDCCNHMYCFACIDEWARITNLCPLCKQRFRFITRLPLSEAGVVKPGQVLPGSSKLVDQKDQRAIIYDENPSLYFPQHFIDEDAVECLPGSRCHFRANPDDDTDGGTTSVGCDSCERWFHTSCVGFSEDSDPSTTWHCPFCLGTTSPAEENDEESSSDLETDLRSEDEQELLEIPGVAGGQRRETLRRKTKRRATARSRARPSGSRLVRSRRIMSRKREPVTSRPVTTRPQSASVTSRPPSATVTSRLPVTGPEPRKKPTKEEKFQGALWAAAEKARESLRKQQTEGQLSSPTRLGYQTSTGSVRRRLVERLCKGLDGRGRPSNGEIQELRGLLKREPIHPISQTPNPNPKPNPTPKLAPRPSSVSTRATPRTVAVLPDPPVARVPEPSVFRSVVNPGQRQSSESAETHKQKGNGELAEQAERGPVVDQNRPTMKRPERLDADWLKLVSPKTALENLFANSPTRSSAREPLSTKKKSPVLTLDFLEEHDNTHEQVVQDEPSSSKPLREVLRPANQQQEGDILKGKEEGQKTSVSEPSKGAFAKQEPSSSGAFKYLTSLPAELRPKLPNSLRCKVPTSIRQVHLNRLLEQHLRLAVASNSHKQPSELPIASKPLLQAHPSEKEKASTIITVLKARPYFATPKVEEGFYNGTRTASRTLNLARSLSNKANEKSSDWLLSFGGLSEEAVKEAIEAGKKEECDVYSKCVSKGVYANLVAKALAALVNKVIEADSKLDSVSSVAPVKESQPIEFQEPTSGCKAEESDVPGSDKPTRQSLGCKATDSLRDDSKSRQEACSSADERPSCSAQEPQEEGYPESGQDRSSVEKHCSLRAWQEKAARVSQPILMYTPYEEACALKAEQPEGREQVSKDDEEKRRNHLRKQVAKFVYEHLRPLQKSQVATKEQCIWATDRTAEKVLSRHYHSSSADFLIREGSRVRELSEKYLNVAKRTDCGRRKKP